jgi:hypothetical protein
MGHTKTRDLSTLEYLDVLVKEYFVAELRRRIYTKASDRKYWKRTSSFKKEKIIDISNRNRLPHIFSNEEKMSEAYDMYYPLNELPKILLNKKDLYCYYKKDTDVTITDNGKVLVGKILNADVDTAKVDIVLFDNNKKETYRFNQVRRIL